MDTCTHYKVPVAFRWFFFRWWIVIKARPMGLALSRYSLYKNTCDLDSKSLNNKTDLSFTLHVNIRVLINTSIQYITTG